MKIASYEGVYKTIESFEHAKQTNGNIDDFTQYPVYRALRYKPNHHDAITRLCSNANLNNLQEGTWVVEQPKMIDDKIQYEYLSDDVFTKTFQKYDASGILGCGPGSERFN